jgi:hypothetical protein
VDSWNSTASITSSGVRISAALRTVAVAVLRRRGTISATKATVTMPPHQIGGAPRKDSAVKARMPSRLPIRSNRYAVSRGSSRKQRPTSSAGPASTTAAAMNTIGRITHTGGPVVLRLVK